MLQTEHVFKIAIIQFLACRKILWPISNNPTDSAPINKQAILVLAKSLHLSSFGNVAVSSSFKAFTPSKTLRYGPKILDFSIIYLLFETVSGMEPTENCD